MVQNVGYINWGSKRHPDKIYKYRKWNRVDNRKILIENEIYFLQSHLRLRQTMSLY